MTKKGLINNLITDFDNPILKEIKDTGGIKETFTRFPFIPYAGTTTYTSNKYLELLLDLINLNPTLAGCINSIGDYCFNSGQTLYEKSNNLFISEQASEAPLNVQLSFTELITNLNLIVYNNKVDFNHFVKGLYYEIKNGNCYVELIRTSINGVTQYTYKIHPQTHCLYKVNSDDTLSMAVSKSFDYNYLRKYPAREVPMYPEVDDRGDEIRTMFHFKTKTDGVYGRPDYISCFLNIYNEYQNSLYRVKLAGRGFSPQVLIEVEGDDPSIVADQSDEDKIDRIIENYTIGGDKTQTILAMERPHGARPVEVHEFSIHTKEDYYDKIGQINEREILKANNWSKLLLTGEVPTGFATTPYEDELRNREKSVLRKYQTKVSSMFSELTEPMFNDQNEELNNYSISFNLPYEDITDSEGSNTEQSG